MEWIDTIGNIGGYPSDDNIDENGNQIIEVQETSWEVLGIEDTDQDGIFETLLITTQGHVQPYLEFYGAPAYTNSSSEINKICKELYSNSEYGEARGMTINDVNSALNYTPFGGMYKSGSTYYTTGNLTTKIKDLPIFSQIVAEGTYTPDGRNTAEALGDYELNGYIYEFFDNGRTITDREGNTYENEVTDIEYKTIFGDENNYYGYYLASCSVSIWNNDVRFGLDVAWGRKY